MQLSVVIPTKDRPEFLEGNLNTLIEQTSKEYSIEVCVVDDGSSKNNYKKNQNICTDKNVLFFRNDKSQGQGAARNKGIKETSGTWIAFLDDDITVNENWVQNAFSSINNNTTNVGIEGKTYSSGNGLWDNDVSNLKGNLYLTTNIIYRRKVLKSAGYFDESFKRYAEDQELAERIKRYGSIIFEPSISVTHAPRKISFLNLIPQSFSNMENYLDAEYQFYIKHPQSYCLYRHANTFWQTLFNTCTKYLFTTLKKRGFLNITKRPYQGILLLLSALLRQFASTLFAPKYILLFTLSKTYENVLPIINTYKTKELLGFKSDKNLKLITNSPNITDKFIKFKNGRQSYYKKISQTTIHNKAKMVIRIDDLFLNNKDGIKKMCEIFKKTNTPFIAGIKGEDLSNNNYSDMLDVIKNSGGDIALHGMCHTGKQGPFPSELLQMDIDKLKELGKFTFGKNAEKPQILIPPYNAISLWQIKTLSKYFKLICTGPESGRFTSYISSTIVLGNDSILMPSLPPLYNKSSDLVANKTLSNLRGVLPITLHLNWEEADSFRSLTNFLNLYKDKIVSWKELIGEKSVE